MRDALGQVLFEVGLDHPKEALLDFLRDPNAFKVAFKKQAAQVLLDRGDEAARAGASARALRSYGRVLAIDPDHPAVASRLSKLRRTRLRRRGIVALLIATVAAALLFAGAREVLSVLSARRALPPEASAAVDAAPPPEPSKEVEGAFAPAPPEAPPKPGPASEASPPPALPAPAPRPAPRPAAVAAVVAPATPVPAPPAPVQAPELTQLSVYVRPYAQRALLDGVEVARGQQLVRFELRPGPHVIQIEHACCTPFVKQLTAEEAAHLGELRVPLEPRPARLRVEGDPDTRVFVNGKALGTAGDSQRIPFAVPLPSEGENPYEAQARIGLQGAGGAAREIQVRLRAGGEVTVAAPEPEETP